MFRDFILPLLRVSPWNFPFDLPKLQSHRGAWKGSHLTENSIDSLRRASQLGFGMAEFDVRLSQDNVPVLYHDESLRRLHGVDKKISELTAEQLTEIGQVSRLKDVLIDEQTPEFLNIELKTDDYFNSKLERMVAEVVTHFGQKKHIMFSSFNAVALWKMAKLLPQFPRAFLVKSFEQNPNAVFFRQFLLVPFLEIHMINIEDRLFDSTGSFPWQNNQIPLSVWTVNNKHDVEHYLKLGVKSVITDLDSESELSEFLS